MVELEPLMNVKVILEPVRDLGDTPLGRRRVIGITGGSFSGPRLSGKVLPGGAGCGEAHAHGTSFSTLRGYAARADADGPWI